MEDARTLLKGYRLSRSRIAALSTELANMTASLNSVRSVVAVAEDNDLSAASEATARVVEMLGREINEAIERCDLALGALASLGNTEERAVLELYYISGMTLREIATEKLYCCLTTVKNLHHRGLAAVDAYLVVQNN